MINIDPEQAITYGNEIITDAGSYSSEIKVIYDIITDLKNSWSGTAAQRFTDNVESYKQSFEELGQYLNDVGELLVAIGKDYNSLEENL